MNVSSLECFLLWFGVAATVGGVALALILQGWAWLGKKDIKTLGNCAVTVGSFLGAVALIVVFSGAWVCEKWIGVVANLFFLVAFVLFGKYAIPRLNRQKGGNPATPANPPTPWKSTLI